MSHRPVPTILAEPSPVLRNAAAQLLDAHPRFHLLAAGEDLAEVSSPRLQRRACMALTGLHDTDGVQRTARLLARWTDPMWVVMYPRPSRELVAAAVRSGADGVVCGQAPPDQVVRVLSGATMQVDGVAMCPLTEALSQGSDSASIAASLLTRREAEVLACVSRGMTLRATASQLKVDTGRVRAWFNRARVKLGASDRHSALVRARELGLLDRIAG